MTSGKAVIQTQVSLSLDPALLTGSEEAIFFSFPGSEVLPVSGFEVSDSAAGLWEAF